MAILNLDKITLHRGERRNVPGLRRAGGGGAGKLGWLRKMMRKKVNKMMRYCFQGLQEAV